MVAALPPPEFDHIGHPGAALAPLEMTALEALGRRFLKQPDPRDDNEHIAALWARPAIRGGAR